MCLTITFIYSFISINILACIRSKTNYLQTYSATQSETIKHFLGQPFLFRHNNADMTVTLPITTSNTYQQHQCHISRINLHRQLFASEFAHPVLIWGSHLNGTGAFNNYTQHWLTFCASTPLPLPTDPWGWLHRASTYSRKYDMQLTTTNIFPTKHSWQGWLAATNSLSFEQFIALSPVFFYTWIRACWKLEDFFQTNGKRTFLKPHHLLLKPWVQIL